MQSSRPPRRRCWVLPERLPSDVPRDRLPHDARVAERFPFGTPLLGGRLVRRYKRFLADIALDDGTPVTAHCPNSGSMTGMAEPGSRVMLSRSDRPTRKLAWTWELVEPPGGPWVGCNTMRPNHVVAWAIEQGLVPGIDSEEPLRREVRYGSNSRIDLLVGDHHVEVKNTTLAAGRVARFPDAVTARGTKHMDELAHIARSGRPATVVFFVNRADCDRFAVAQEIDPVYAKSFAAARDAGVRMLPLGMDVSPDGWSVRGPLPIVEA